MASSLNDWPKPRVLTLPDRAAGEFLCITDPVTDSNCYLLRREGACVLIDPNCFPAFLPVLEAWRPGLLLVLLTHEHCDHISGLNALRERFPCVVAASRSCSLGMQDTKLNMSRLMETFLYYKNGETTITPYAPFWCGPADLSFDGEICLPFGDGKIWMKSLPGHTPGSSVIAMDFGLFCGDYLLPGELVLTRLPGGSEADYNACAKPWLRGIPNGEWVYPGHGMEFQMEGKVRDFHGL